MNKFSNQVTRGGVFVLAFNDEPHQDIARAYNVSDSSISRILNGGAYAGETGLTKYKSRLIFSCQAPVPTGVVDDINAYLQVAKVTFDKHLKFAQNNKTANTGIPNSVVSNIIIPKINECLPTEPIDVAAVERAFETLHIVRTTDVDLDIFEKMRQKEIEEVGKTVQQSRQKLADLHGEFRVAKKEYLQSVDEMSSNIKKINEKYAEKIKNIKTI